MAKLSLRKREISNDADERMRSIIDEFGALEDDAKEIAIKMLAHSQPFIRFIDYVAEKDGESRGQTRLIDVGSRFQEWFADFGAQQRSLTWAQAVARSQPDILSKNIGRDVSIDDRSVKVGWHSVLTPKKDGEGYVIIGAKTSQRGSVQHEGQMRMLAELFPDLAYGYDNIRHDSNYLETNLGLRRGRMHFFLSDDALQNTAGVALHKSYLNAGPDELIVITMHARFFFVCHAKDLSDWLKTNDAREAFGGNLLRIQGHRYPATAADIEHFSPMSSFSVEDFINQRGDMINRIPEQHRAGAYLSTMDRALPGLAPHLTWKTDIALEQFDVQSQMRELLDK